MRTTVTLHLLCTVLLTLYLFSYQRRIRLLEPKYNLCDNLSGCVVSAPRHLIKKNFLLLCQTRRVDACTGDAYCCTACLKSPVTVKNNSSVPTIKVYNQHTTLLKTCMAVACVYIAIYFFIVCLKLTQHKNVKQKRIKAIVTGIFLVIGMLLLGCTATTTGVYLYVHKLLTGCQPIFIAYATWTYTMSTACIDSIVQLIISKHNKPTFNSRENTVFNIFSIIAKSATVIFNKVNKICLLWYVTVIAYLESVKAHLLYPIR